MFQGNVCVVGKTIAIYLYTNFWIKLLYKCICFLPLCCLTLKLKLICFPLWRTEKGCYGIGVYQICNSGARSRFMSSLPKAPPVAALASGARRIQQSRSCHVINERAFLWKCVFRKVLRLWLFYSPPNMADRKKVYVFSSVAPFSELEKFFWNMHATVDCCSFNSGSRCLDLVAVLSFHCCPGTPSSG